MVSKKTVAIGLAGGAIVGAALLAAAQKPPVPPEDVSAEIVSIQVT